jgi:beta-phosphoglucomutase-like phosphatase (HAD superfamily)
LTSRPRFQAFVSAHEVQDGKPNPALFLAAAELETLPGRSIVVEDAPAGTEAAHRGGMRAIGVLTSRHNLQADVVVPTLEHLRPDAFDTLVPRD